MADILTYPHSLPNQLDNKWNLGVWKGRHFDLSQHQQKQNWNSWEAATFFLLCHFLVCYKSLFSKLGFEWNSWSTRKTLFFLAWHKESSTQFDSVMDDKMQIRPLPPIVSMCFLCNLSTKKLSFGTIVMHLVTAKDK